MRPTGHKTKKLNVRNFQVLRLVIMTFSENGLLCCPAIMTANLGRAICSLKSSHTSPHYNEPSLPKTTSNRIKKVNLN